ncbi:hypothetical protein KBI33_00985 [Candidatus Shapirobacteria bacterium]|nr:hypothetical protein [Candidatus Shapirobacteria bacterium]
MSLKKGEEEEKRMSLLAASITGWQTNPTYVAEGDVPTIYGLEGVVTNILNIIISVVGAILLFTLIMGGFRYITSGGDKEQTAKAKKTLTYGIIGLLVVMGAWLIIRLIEEFTGLNLHIFQIPKI